MDKIDIFCISAAALAAVFTVATLAWAAIVL